MHTNQESAWESETSWLHWLLANVRLVIFLLAAFAGMIAVYWYFSPAEATAEIIAATTEGSPSAPFYKPVAARPVVQRLAQSPGPLRIGIISGHKGNDSGTVCLDGLTEALVVENIANQVATQLQTVGVPVDILEEFDPRFGQYSATAVISLHADSCVYYHDGLTGYKIAGSSLTNSNALQTCMEQEYGRITQLPFHSFTITEDMTDYHAFRELPAGVPAIILEVGFMNLDRDILTNRSDVPAAGVYAGIQCYLSQLGFGN
jgi:N-acetylmuramoyl-L-alanine amidase